MQRKGKSKIHGATLTPTSAARSISLTCIVFMVQQSAKSERLRACQANGAALVRLRFACVLLPTVLIDRSIANSESHNTSPLGRGCEWIARSSNRCRKCSICVYACVHVCLCMRICIQDSQMCDSAVRTHSKGTCTHARNPAHPNLYGATRDGG